MATVPCDEGKPGSDGFLVAWDADTGKERWRFKTLPIESSPLLRNDTLYVGAWDHKVHAIDARTGRQKWAFQADDQVNTSAAYWKGTIYIASDGGTLYALDAGTGKLRWSAQSNARFGSREFWYATPTVAYGRVYIGNTNGEMYAFGARSGKLLWARPLGSYIYGAAGGLQPQGLRRHLRRPVLRARRGHRRRALADRGRRRGARGADGHGRARLLRDLLELRLRGAALGRARTATRHTRCARATASASGPSATASTRTRWSPTRSASTSRVARTSTR